MMILDSILDVLRNIKHVSAIHLSHQATLEQWFGCHTCHKFLELYYSLGDDESRVTLIKVIKFYLSIYLTGYPGVHKFYSDEEWKSLSVKAEGIESPILSYPLDMIETWILEGYRHGNKVFARPGATVLDCGAYTGLTAYYFSRQVGENGQVYAFEGMPETADILRENIGKCGAANIIPVNRAVYSSSCKMYFSERSDPSASLSSSATTTETRSISLDEFAFSQKLQNIGFIKMDIEGAEAEALKGAARIISRDSPDLAISVYHKPDDMIVIPALIHKINPNYVFYLKHNSNSACETVLFAHAASCRLATLKSMEHIMREAKMISKLWDFIKCLTNQNNRSFRKNLLDSCANALAGMDRFFNYPNFDEKEYTYAYYPLSNDKRVHYEFYILDNNLQICLHMEGPYTAKRGAIEKLCALSCLSSPLQKTPLGFAYIMPLNISPQIAAGMMSYLKKISLPLLKDEKILSDFLQIELMRKE